MSQNAVSLFVCMILMNVALILGAVAPLEGDLVFAFAFASFVIGLSGAFGVLISSFVDSWGRLIEREEAKKNLRQESQV